MKFAQNITLIALSFFVAHCSYVFAAEVGGTVRELNLKEGETTTFTAPTRCEKLTVSGAAEIRSADEVRDMFMTESVHAHCPENPPLPNSIVIACDEVVFAEGSEIHTWSHLRLYGGIIRGPLKIVGLRNRNGIDGDPIDTSSAALHGANGINGGNGANGQNAGHGMKDFKYWKRGATSGGNGGPGQNGQHGQDGAPGNAGSKGENNVCVTIHTENFDGDNSIRIILDGGIGGAGSDGQNGGKGGNGGNAGHGGKGGDSDDVGGRSRHGGNGGRGGDGGNGGHGGDGGNGGDGGDGGRIEVVIQEDMDGKGVRPLDSELANWGGEGGVPGVGGTGGRGGNGGSGGSGGSGGDGSMLLYEGGHTGGAGSPGDPGKPGEDGKSGTWGQRGKKGLIVENIIGYGEVNTPTPIDWNIITQ